MLRQGCLLLLMVMPALPVCADIYRWTDANGQVHFSDRAAAGDAQKVEPQDVQNLYQNRTPAMTDTSADARQTEREVREARRQRQLRQDRAEKLAQKHRLQCEKARQAARVNALKSGSSLAALQKKQQRRETLNGRIRQYCY